MSVEMALKFNGKVRVNAIAPGFFIGNQNRSLLLNDDGSYTKRGNTIINNLIEKKELLLKEILFNVDEASNFDEKYKKK